MKKNNKGLRVGPTFKSVTETAVSFLSSSSFVHFAYLNKLLFVLLLSRKSYKYYNICVFFFSLVALDLIIYVYELYIYSLKLEALYSYV